MIRFFSCDTLHTPAAEILKDTYCVFDPIKDSHRKKITYYIKAVVYKFTSVNVIFTCQVEQKMFVPKL